MRLDWIKRLKREYGHESVVGKALIMAGGLVVVLVAMYWLAFKMRGL